MFDKLRKFIKALYSPEEPVDYSYDVYVIFKDEDSNRTHEYYVHTFPTRSGALSSCQNALYTLNRHSGLMPVGFKVLKFIGSQPFGSPDYIDVDTVLHWDY